MTQIRFLRDFRGRASAEQYFENGAIANLPDELVVMLLAEGAVEKTGPAAIPPVPAAAPAAPKPRRGRPKKTP